MVPIDQVGNPDRKESTVEVCKGGGRERREIQFDGGRHAPMYTSEFDAQRRKAVSV